MAQYDKSPDSLNAVLIRYGTNLVADTGVDIAHTHRFSDVLPLSEAQAACLALGDAGFACDYFQLGQGRVTAWVWVTC